MADKFLVQPRLMDAWGVEFHGQAQTTIGDVWWYEQDGKRYPLLPMEPEASLGS